MTSPLISTPRSFKLCRIHLESHLRTSGILESLNQLGLPAYVEFHLHSALESPVVYADRLLMEKRHTCGVVRVHFTWALAWRTLPKINLLYGQSRLQ
jgi:hypothetical protein